MHPSARALSWKAAGRDNTADEFAAIFGAGFTEASRKRDQELRQRREVEELAKKGRPIQIRTFQC